jgi:hypothetical protein
MFKCYIFKYCIFKSYIFQKLYISKAIFLNIEKIYMVSKTRKIRKNKKGQPTKGWSKLKPSTHQRTLMLKKCGKRCFLGPNKSFPICRKQTCKVSSKGVYAAYIRAKQWGKSKKTYKTTKPTLMRKTYKSIAAKAKRILRRTFEYKHVGKSAKK